MVCGIAVGIMFGESASNLKLVSDIFIRLIKMIISPLLYVSIVMGITSVDDKKAVSRITIKSMCAFLLSTSFAVVIGLVAATLLKPGQNVSPESFGEVGTISHNQFSFINLITDTIPDNALNALVSSNTLQVVFFAFFTGFILNTMHEQRKAIHAGFQLAAKVIFKMITAIVSLAPYAAFAMMATIVGKQGVAILYNLGLLIITIMGAFFVQYLFFGLIILVFGRISPLPFYKKSVEYQTVALATSSSKATLPTTIDVCLKRLGMSKTSSSFVLPLGAAINMDGVAIYLGVCALFFAQAYQINLTSIDYGIIILSSTLGSIGAAGIPSGSLLMLPMLLSSVNIPLAGVALVVGIDRIIDMVRTTVSITGDATVALVIDATEGTLDKKQYRSK
jgi:Na+/H+-dicarboxylate symporter